MYFHDGRLVSISLNDLYHMEREQEEEYMSETVSGVVEVNFTNPKGFKSLKLEDKGWYGFGKNEIPCTKGDRVSFEFDVNGNFNNGDIKTLEVEKNDTPKQATASGGSTSSGGGSYDNRQASIVYQSSRKDAIQVVGILLDKDAIKLPTKKADQMDAIMSLVAMVTDGYASAALNPSISPVEEESSGIPKKQTSEGDDWDE